MGWELNEDLQNQDRKVPILMQLILEEGTR